MVHLMKYIPPHLRRQQEQKQKECISAAFEKIDLNHEKNLHSSATIAAAAEIQKPSSPSTNGTSFWTKRPSSRQASYNEKVDIIQVLKLPCHAHCDEFKVPQGTSGELQKYCPHHQFLEHDRTFKFASFYRDKSITGVFENWLKLKRLDFPSGSPGINKCFQKKAQDTKKMDQAAGVRYSSSPHAVPELFNRFLRYAIDIDNGVDFVGHAVKTSRENPSFAFIDIGFAPGGMSHLLLEAIPTAKGVGINLDPALGGNVYPSVFDTHERFQVLTRDIIQLARDHEYKFEIPACDLVIVGITTSGSSQKNASELDELELKNLLHFSQLLVAFRNLKIGGSILIRMHLGLRIVDAHLLAFLLENFDQSTVKASKPLSEFAMRKTFWVHCSGFNPVSNATTRLENLIRDHQPAPYASQSPFSDSLNGPFLMKESDDELLERYGAQIFNILEPMWGMQAYVLEAIVSGLQERACFNCKKANWPCSFCSKKVPRRILNSLMEVNKRMKQSYIPKSLP
jgi:hypothetical protein